MSFQTNNSIGNAMNTKMYLPEVQKEERIFLLEIQENTLDEGFDKDNVFLHLIFLKVENFLTCY